MSIIKLAVLAVAALSSTVGGSVWGFSAYKDRKDRQKQDADRAHFVEVCRERRQHQDRMERLHPNRKDDPPSARPSLRLEDSTKEICKKIREDAQARMDAMYEHHLEEQRKAYRPTARLSRFEQLLTPWVIEERATVKAFSALPMSESTSSFATAHTSSSTTSLSTSSIFTSATSVSSSSSWSFLVGGTKPKTRTAEQEWLDEWASWFDCESRRTVFISNCPCWTCDQLTEPMPADKQATHDEFHEMCRDMMGMGSRCYPQFKNIPSSKIADDELTELNNVMERPNFRRNGMLVSPIEPIGVEGGAHVAEALAVKVEAVEPKNLAPVPKKKHTGVNIGQTKRKAAVKAVAKTRRG